MKRKVTAKLIATYRMKRFEQNFDLTAFESESKNLATESFKNKAIGLDNSKIDKMRKRIQGIMTDQTFSTHRKEKNKNTKKKIKIQQ